MESEVADSEGLMFRGLDSRHPDALRNTTAACDAIDTPNESAHLRVASETDQRVFGPAKMLPVQPGDKIKLSVQAQYVPSTDNQTYSANLATLFLSAFTGGGPGAIESGSAAYQGLSEALGAGALLGRDEGDVPRAYLRYILFDKHYQPVANFNDQNSMRISEAGANAAETLASSEISIDRPGYLYVYVSNESNWATDVFFDDLVIEHERGTVVQSQDFYPFGMAHQPHTRYENKFLFQGKEWQHELALNWFDFHARQYDPALGRWNSLDPLADEMRRHSPYNFAFDNPLRFIDPDGMSPYSTHTDWAGNVVAVYDDGDLGVYQHHMDFASTQAHLANNYSSWNTGAGGQYMGSTLHTGSFADFEHFKGTGEIIAANNAMIDFESNWAGNQIRSLLTQSRSFVEYATNAGYGEDYDIKSSLSPGGIYYGSKLHSWGGNLYVSARDAGNILAGAMAAKHHVPKEQAFSGFGALEYSKIFGFPGGSKIVGGSIWLLDFVFPILKTSYTRYENELTHFGIQYGYRNYHSTFK